MDSGDVSYQSSWDCFCKALIFLQIGSVTCFRNTGGVTQCKNKCWQYLSLFANHRYAACCCVGSIWNVLLWQHCAYDLRLRKRYSFGLKYLLGSPQTHLAIVQGLIKNAFNSTMLKQHRTVVTGLAAFLLAIVIVYMSIWFVWHVQI